MDLGMLWPKPLIQVTHPSSRSHDNPSNPEKSCRIFAARGDILVTMMKSDLDLLEQFSRQNSEEAFAALVHRHLGLVYSAALRQVRSPELAKEVAQSVFSDLGRHAHRL